VTSKRFASLKPPFSNHLFLIRFIRLSSQSFASSQTSFAFLSAASPTQFSQLLCLALTFILFDAAVQNLALPIPKFMKSRRVKGPQPYPLSS
jgi:hypothetical protein